MLFNSLEFFIFLPFCLLAIFAAPGRYRWAVVLLASYWFYMSWKPVYGLLILASTTIDYWAGLQLDRPGASQSRRRTILAVSVVANLAILFYFKYFNYGQQIIQSMVTAGGRNYVFQPIDLLLPIGISFYTFQSMSYTIDVFRRERSAERHPGIFALYVSFFPQLVAGPIERSTALLPQLRKLADWDRERFFSGARLVTWGFFKKLVIADRAAAFVDPVFNSPGSYDASTLVIATIMLGYQFYCDFSGYSDIAMGLARILGVRLSVNFDRPYQSRTVTEFWNRWHITLYSWFRDYVYRSLGGNRVGQARWFINVLVVFGLSGLWHGAEHSFVVFGLLNGLYIVGELGLRRFRRQLLDRFGFGLPGRIYHLLDIVRTYTLIHITFVYFRALNVRDGNDIIVRIIADAGQVGSTFLSALVGGAGLDVLAAAARVPDLKAVVIAILFLEVVQWRQGRRSLTAFLDGMGPGVRYLFFVIVGFLILYLGKFDAQPFVYFQF